MKISWKRMGIQTLAILLGGSVLWGAGNVNPVLLEKTRDALTTSIDVTWVMEKANSIKNWVEHFEDD